MHFFQASTSAEQLLFRKKNIFRSGYFLSAVTFSEMLVMRNQLIEFISGKTSLTIIYSFSYTMSWLDIEIPQFCINLNTGCVKYVTFQKVIGIFKQALASKRIPQHFWFKRCCCNNMLKIDVAVTKFCQICLKLCMYQPISMW